MKWRLIGPAAAMVLAMAFAGPYTVTKISSDVIRKALPFILLLVAGHTFRRKELGSVHAPLQSRTQEKIVAILIGMLFGFYDGFFGPGTGTFLVFSFVRLLGVDFLGASASAKIINIACNLAALIWFGYSGHMIWGVGLGMATLNVAGALIGSHLAVQGGSRVIRQVFLFALCALILNTGWSAPHLP